MNEDVFLWVYGLVGVAFAFWLVCVGVMQVGVGIWLMFYYDQEKPKE